MAIQTHAQAPAARPVENVHVHLGSTSAPILVVCDAPKSDERSMSAYRAGKPLTDDALRLVARVAEANGLSRDDFVFVRLCPPISEVDLTSDKRQWDHVQPHAETLKALVQRAKPKLVVTMGALASRALIGRSVKITKARGQVEEREGFPPIFPMLSPGFVMKVPEHEPTFNADFLTLSKLKANGWTNQGMVKTPTDYQWRSDISDILGENKPKLIAIDTETTGLKWYHDYVFPFLVQISTRPGQALLCPIHERYWEKVFPGEPLSKMHELIRQVAELVEDPAVKMMGHNFKYDHHMLSKIRVCRQDRSRGFVKPRGWQHETSLLAFQINENMMEKSLDECVRAFVPEMAGYADSFNATIDKSNMINVPPEDVLDLEGNVIQYGMRNYAGGDPDAVYRLASTLLPMLKKDMRQYNVYRRVQMPALLMFAQVTEPAGVKVDQEYLRTFGQELKEWMAEEYKWLIRQVPAKVRRKHMQWSLDTKKKGADPEDALSFTRPDFTRDVLFSKDGFNLKPQVFTESTAKLPAAQRVASTSAKDHFPYFVTDSTAGEFVLRLGDFLKTKHMEATYVGSHNEGNGFWQYIGPDGCIHPSFWLTRTNTGRTASSDPNGQNFPKRGRWAKPYQKNFIPKDGCCFAASDLSQIELRLIAWMANEPTMLKVYRDGGDIHETTAAVAAGIDEVVFKSWKKDNRLLIDCANEIPGSGAYLQSLNPGKRREAKVSDFYKLQRFRAKAVNFGFCYGAQASTFRTYAKTEYGVDYTEEEAVLIRQRYFKKYAALARWHEVMKEIAHEKGYVRAMHGAVRHLPSIYSQDRGIVASSERQAINAPIQRMGSDLCLVGAIRFQAQVDPSIARIVLTVHDQIVLECKLGYEEEMIQALCWCMQNPPLGEWFGIESPIPIGSDAEIGYASLGEMEERPDLEGVKPDWWNADEQSVINAFVNGAPVYAYREGVSQPRFRELVDA